MANIERIAFIKVGDFSHINPNVGDFLRREFPQARLDVIDLADLGMRSMGRLSLSWLAAFAEYGPKALRGRHEIERHAQRTRSYFAAVRSRLSRVLSAASYSFTFQTQSTFDASQRGTPHFVYTDHTHLTNLYYPAFDRSSLYSRRWIDLERTIYTNAAVNFTMSSHVSRSMVEHYACDPLQVECVHIGSNIPIPLPSDLPDDRYARKEILFVGIDWERKGGPLLVRAFETVLRKHPGAHLTVIGCSPALSVRNCSVLGRLPLHEVAAYYRNASIFCLPTQIEPFGVVFLEACAHRLPIVSTSIGALPDIVEDGVSGYLVAPDAVEALADRLIRLLDSPSRCREFGETGFERMRERFTWQRAGQRMAERIKTLGALGN